MTNLAVAVDETMNSQAFLNWLGEKEEKYELIEGVPVVKASAKGRHARAISNLHFHLRLALRGKPCEVLMESILFRTDYQTTDKNALLPDLFLLCKGKHLPLNENNMQGGPTMAIEVLSPSTLRRDKIYKFNKYLDAGVAEYWIVDPARLMIDVNVLRDSGYMTRSYSLGDTVTLTVAEEVSVSVDDIFEGLSVDEDEN